MYVHEWLLLAAENNIYIKFCSMIKREMAK
jgi:hypothetical protein